MRESQTAQVGISLMGPTQFVIPADPLVIAEKAGTQATCTGIAGPGSGPHFRGNDELWG
jgi:hypothetical protein